MDISIQGIVILVVVTLVIYLIGTYNGLIRLKNKVRELESDIDVALEKRYDLLKKQYDIVSRYMTYESQTLIEAIKLRRVMTHDEQEQVMGQMSAATDRINATFEAYPQLASSENVLALQRSCDNVEDHLQAARRLYNAGATNYNNKCRMFPSNIIAAITGHCEVSYFRADEEKLGQP